VNAPLARRRCWSHATREAVSRCPSCKKFYCRECVTEHDGRLLCVTCLAAAGAATVKRTGTRWIVWMTAAIAGLLITFFLHATLGYVLEKLPPSWGRGTDDE